MSSSFSVGKEKVAALFIEQEGTAVAESHRDLAYGHRYLHDTDQ